MGAGEVDRREPSAEFPDGFGTLQYVLIKSGPELLLPKDGVCSPPWSELGRFRVPDVVRERQAHSVVEAHDLRSWQVRHWLPGIVPRAIAVPPHAVQRVSYLGVLVGRVLVGSNREDAADHMFSGRFGGRRAAVAAHV